MSIDRARLEKQLRIDEGERLKPYRCTAGKLTIGVGRNLDDRGITKEESAVMLDRDIRNCLADLAFFLPWYKQLNAARQEALINMCFALGMPGLRGFKNMLEGLKEGNWKQAHDEALDSNWARELQRLRSKRLICIANTFLTGEPIYANT
ncbi:MAG: glycoside hydrolase family protein [Thalassospira sp.]|nr:glycoside hydrolase family protein [Thalassospira sp.]